MHATYSFLKLIFCLEYTSHIKAQMQYNNITCIELQNFKHSKSIKCLIFSTIIALMYLILQSTEYSKIQRHKIRKPENTRNQVQIKYLTNMRHSLASNKYSERLPVYNPSQPVSNNPRVPGVTSALAHIILTLSVTDRPRAYIYTLYRLHPARRGRLNEFKMAATKSHPKGYNTYI